MKAILFDLDGTITHLTLPLDEMRQDTKDYFISKGYPADGFDPSDGISSSRLKAKEYFNSNGISESEWGLMEAELDKMLSAHENWAATDAEVIDGALETVIQIRNRGLKTAILTNNNREAVDSIMDRIPFQNLFDLILTRHETPNPKPFPDGLVQAARELGVHLSDAVYVGDARIDGAAAQRAGMEFWGITSGETDKDHLIESGASLVFDSIQGIISEIDRRIKRQ
ncbi:MAG: HAD family phosphatase [Candidatus Thorarchaeota archaeon]|nr:HAD family phosphatase [Candidatus Thorarchaeota archaeon]